MFDIEKEKIELYEKYQKLSFRDRNKLAYLSIRREFSIYCIMAKGKDWNRENDYKELFDSIWKCIENDEMITEELWDIHEKIKPESVNVDIQEYYTTEMTMASIFSTNMSSYIEMLIDATGHEEAFSLLNYDFINMYLEEIECTNNRSILYENEKKFQESSYLVIHSIHNTKEIKKYLEMYTNILGI